VVNSRQRPVCRIDQCSLEGDTQMIRIRTVAALAAIALTTVLSTAGESFAGDACCAPAPVCCAPAPVCCCPPAPIQTTICVAPPCSSCSQNVSVCVPGCCTEAPTVCWRKGLLGRQIGTYTWACCGHSVKVVVTRRGDVKVRG